MASKILKFFWHVVILYGYMIAALAVVKEIRPDIYLSGVAKITYIADINLPDTQKEMTNNIIDELNGVGLSYSGFSEVIAREGYRPVFINPDQGELDAFREGLSGMATVHPAWCSIYLNQDLFDDPEQFRLTLIHEILHCYGYEHNPNITDIMYYSSSNATELSIVSYVRDLVRHRKNWGDY